MMNGGEELPRCRPLQEPVLNLMRGWDANYCTDSEEGVILTLVPRTVTGNLLLPTCC